MHRKLALPPPIMTLGCENAVHPDVEHCVLHDLDAPESLRTVTQDFVDEVGRGDSHRVAMGDAEMVKRTKFVGPRGKGLMGPRNVDLQKITNEWQSLRTRKFVERA